MSYLKLVVVMISLIAESNRFSYSKYEIGHVGNVKISNQICGVWSDTADTDKGSYITIQPHADRIKEWTQQNPELAKTVHKNEMPTTAEIKNSFFVSYVTNHGESQMYGGRFVASKIGNDIFLSLPYAYGHFDTITAINSSVKGYVFYKLVSLTDKEMVLSRFADPELPACNSEQEVKAKITSHINATTYYQPEVHYYKRVGIHLQRV